MHQEIISTLPLYSHEFFNSADELESFSNWKERGKPYLWVMVEDKKGYQAWMDFGHGVLVLTRGDKCLGYGKYSVVHGDIVCLDKEYSGSSSYLFFAN